jgi:serine/threonine-protein kinase
MTKPTDGTLSLRGRALARALEQLWHKGQQPDPFAFIDRAGPCPPGVAAAVLAVDQWHRWRAGQRLPAEDYLGRCPAVAGDTDAALELIYGEFLVRQALGERPAAAEYLDRFPGFAACLRVQFEFLQTLQSGGDAAGNGSSALPPSRPHGPPLPPTERLPNVPGYEVQGELGRGGMGVVYKARHVQLSRVVALKMILSGAHAGGEERRRFLREAEAAARLQHPNIVQVFEVGEAHGHPFFSLEFCPGGPLAAKLNGTPQTAREAARLAETLARAVQAAHEAGVIHRDLKPANVLLLEDGTPKVTDFGLAKLLDDPAVRTANGAIVGTPSYMAPEQASGHGQDVGPATDVYALGALLYEFLTGRPPFKAALPLDTILEVLAEEPAPPRRLLSQTPRDLETIALKCLEKDPRRRYPSALALAEDLRRFREGRPIVARPVGPPERVLKWIRRQPLTAALVAVAALAVGAAIAGALWYNERREQERAAALVENVRTANLVAVPRLVEELAPHRRRAAPLLQRVVRESRPDSGDRFRAALALLPEARRRHCPPSG